MGRGVCRLRSTLPAAAYHAAVTGAQYPVSSTPLRLHQERISQVLGIAESLGTCSTREVPPAVPRVAPEGSGISCLGPGCEDHTELPQVALVGLWDPLLDCVHRALETDQDLSSQEAASCISSGPRQRLTLGHPGSGSAKEQACTRVQTILSDRGDPVSQATLVVVSRRPCGLLRPTCLLRGTCGS